MAQKPKPPKTDGVTSRPEPEEDDAPAPVMSTSTEVTNWDEELAKQAAMSAAMEANTGGNSFFSIRGGILTFNDAAMPNNQMAAVIADSVLENVFYNGDYDPENPAPPTCFAFGRDEATMAPHPSVVGRGQAQHETCRGCPMNEWATAAKGRGKACRNTRRLALLPAGDLDANGRFTAEADPEGFETAAAGFLKLPVTSVKGYAGYVKTIAGTLRRPPHAVFTKIKVVPDAKTQFRVTFDPLGAAPNAILPALMKRNQEMGALIEQPDTLDGQSDAAETGPARGRGAKPTVNKRPPVKKY